MAPQDGYPGHDWLASTVFLLMHGDGERSLRLLLRLSSLLASAFVWPARIHASVSFTDLLLIFSLFVLFSSKMSLRLSWQIHLPLALARSGIPPVYWCTAHYVEMLLKAEVPLVHSAFRMAGFTPSQVGSPTGHDMVT